MSGYKRSRLALQRERENKLRALQSINILKGKIEGIKKEVKTTLEKASSGLKSTFDKQAKDAEEWLKSTKTEERLDSQASLNKLQAQHKKLQDYVSSGEKVFQCLVTSFSEKASGLKKEIIVGLSKLKANYQGHEDLLKAWVKETTIEIEDDIKGIESYLEEEQLGEAEKEIKMIDTFLENRIKDAQELSYKHKKRIYVLKALRQVCTEMGFREISVPKYEEEGNKKSRIVYETDTLDQGKITFYLSLDSIESLSDLMEDRCIEEFDRLSEDLEEKFGVKTSFRPPEEKPDERLIHRNEREQPDEGATMETRA